MHFLAYIPSWGIKLLWIRIIFWVQMNTSVPHHYFPALWYCVTLEAQHRIVSFLLYKKQMKQEREKVEKFTRDVHISCSLPIAIQWDVNHSQCFIDYLLSKYVTPISISCMDSWSSNLRARFGYQRKINHPPFVQHLKLVVSLWARVCIVSRIISRIQ